MTTTVHLGDCIEVMRTMPDASVDAIVTDPPYNLSTSAKRDKKCLREVVSEILLPRDEHDDTERGEGVHLATPALRGADLRGEDWAVRVDAGVGVPEGAVHFEHPTVVQDEVGAGNEPAALATDGDLPLEGDSLSFEFGGDLILQSADGWDATFCNGTCRCFTEPSPGFIAVSVVVPRLAGGNRSGVRLVVEGRDANVGVRHDAGRQAEGPTGVHAGRGAEDRAVLRLDLRGGTGELDLTDRTLDNLTPFQLARAEGVGAGAGAGRLSPVAQPYRVRVVDGTAGQAFTLHHVAHILNSSTGGFMGKEWDGWENPAAFQRWCTAWTVECLRVLKPGGHLLAFGGSRTWHRLAVAVEDAGFELRDSIAWLYGSGFPKSLDVSKAIDKASGAEREVVGRTVTPFRVDNAATRGTSLRGSVNGDFSKQTEDGYRYTEHTAPATPDAERWQGWGTSLKPAFEPIVVARRPLAGTVAANVLAHGTGALNIDACRVPGEVPSVPQPIFGVNGDGVFGTGVGRNGTMSAAPAGRWPTNVVLDGHAADALDEQSGERRAMFFPTFRYQAKAPARERPSYYRPTCECEEAWPTTSPQRDTAATPTTASSSTSRSGSATMGDQSPTGTRSATSTATSSTTTLTTSSPSPRPTTSAFTQAASCETATGGSLAASVEISSPSALPTGISAARDGRSTAGAARATSQMWSATSVCGECGAPTRREAHATVKPLELMRWLVRLATPPGGTVLDPFAGSGTTVEAALLEGMECIAIEREADYIPLIMARIERNTI